MIRRLLTVLLLAGGLAACGNQAASAASPAGVSVSPAFQQVTIQPGEAAHPVEFKITNNEPVAQSFELSAADFNTLGESGGLFFVGTNPTALQKKYGLAKWFSLPQDSITLQPGESTTINANILNLPDLAPGGHYGALMLAAVGGNTPTSNGVALHPIASSLMFVTKVGGDIHTLDLNSVSTNRSLLKLPSKVTLRFQNTGNTHVIPRGVIKLYTASGKLVSQGVINEDSVIILPETYRQIDVPLSKFAGGTALAHYQLKVDFRADGIDVYREYKESFWYIDPGLVAGALLIAGGAAVLIFKRRSLNRRPARKR